MDSARPERDYRAAHQTRDEGGLSDGSVSGQTSK